MRRLALRIVCAAVLLTSDQLNAQDMQHPTLPNGCGSGWNLPIVSDSLPLVGCQFKDSCDKHDICYGKCELSTEGDCEYRRCRKDGDLFGKDICFTDLRLITLGTKALSRKRSCDDGLRSDIRAVNKGKPVCEAFAEVYRAAVALFGDSAFIGIDASIALGQSKEEYARAVQQFFERGTEAQFRKLVESVDSGAQTVDLKKPISFDAKKGLINVPSQ